MKQDAENLVDYLLRQGPPHLFISDELLKNQAQLLNTSPWISRSLPRLKRVYALKDWSSDGKLMHLVRKPWMGPDLFNLRPPPCPGSALYRQHPTAWLVSDPMGGKLLSDMGRPARLPAVLTSTDSNRMTVMLKVRPAARQVDYAALVSTHIPAFAGFVVDRLPGANNEWVLSVGDGQAFETSPPFDIPSDRTSTVVVKFSPTEASVTVDGAAVATLKPGSRPFQPSHRPLIIGDWINFNRPLSGAVDEVFYVDDAATAKVPPPA